MPWTASRSRDEWLAEVQRRGGRLRRRRRLLVALASVVAVAVPAAGAVTVLSGAGGRAVQLNVAGPAPAAVSTTAPDVAPSTTAGAGAGPTDTVEVHRRIAAINGSPVPASPQSSVPATADTLDVKAVHDRPAPAATPPSPAVTSSTVASAPPATTVPDDVPPGPTVSPITTLRPCATSEVTVTVTTDKAVYARGETVVGSWTLEKAAGADCRLEGVNEDGVYTRTATHYETAAGRQLGPTWDLSTGSLPGPAPEPQPTYSFLGLSWDQKDCAGVDPSVLTACPLAPSGTYALVFEWNGAAAGQPSSVGSPHFVGRATFRIGA